MDKKGEIRKLWRETGLHSEDWMAMYFDRVYRDEQALILEADGQIVSTLMLRHYDFLFHGETFPISFLSGAVTRRQQRGKGYMSQLTRDALHLSRERGDLLCALIPAHDWLYFYYDRFGFSTVFYNDVQRFTSLHAFSLPTTENYSEVANHYDNEVYDAMRRLEMLRGCGVLHSRRDFLNILDELRLESEGRFVALKSDMGEVCSMAWAQKRADIVEVKELLSVDPQSSQAALQRLRSYFPDSPFRLLAPAESNHRHLYAAGMARIVNVEMCLGAIASENPSWRSSIRVYDRLLPENSHTYIIKDGSVKINDSYSGRLDFDVTVEVLTPMAFSDRKISDILMFPSQRAHMSLMV